jgi:hypothetical protein
MPCLPLLIVEEAQMCNVELILKQAKISTSILLVSLRALSLKQQIVVDVPEPLNVKIAEFGAHGPSLLAELPSHESQANDRRYQRTEPYPSRTVHVATVRAR